MSSKFDDLCSVPPSIPRPTTTFHQFALLPAELQRMVWQTAIDQREPRVVYIRTTMRYQALEPKSEETQTIHKADASTEQVKTIVPLHQYSSRATVPLLYACQTSRDIAAKVYARAFAMRPTSSYLWFDFEADVLYVDFDCGRLMRTGNKYTVQRAHILLADVCQDVHQVRNIAVAVFPEDRVSPAGHLHQPRRNYIWSSFVICTNVRRILLVDRQHDADEDQHLVITDVVEITKSLELLRQGKISNSHACMLQDIQTSHAKDFEKQTHTDYLYFRASRWLQEQKSGRTLHVERKTITIRGDLQEYHDLKEELALGCAHSLAATEPQNL